MVRFVTRFGQFTLQNTVCISLSLSKFLTSAFEDRFYLLKKARDVTQYDLHVTFVGNDICGCDAIDSVVLRKENPTFTLRSQRIVESLFDIINESEIILNRKLKKNPCRNPFEKVSFEENAVENFHNLLNQKMIAKFSKGKKNERAVSEGE